MNSKQKLISIKKELKILIWLTIIAGLTTFISALIWFLNFSPATPVSEKSSLSTSAANVALIVSPIFVVLLILTIIWAFRKRSYKNFEK